MEFELDYTEREDTSPFPGINMDKRQPECSLTDALKDYFGWDSFRYPQKEVITSILEGNDTLAILPTGKGKSLLYQLPMLLQRYMGVGLVISPLIALMEDQVAKLKEKGIRSECIHAGLRTSQQNEIWSRVISDQVDILYLSPERVAMPAIQEIISDLSISLVAIDEAHVSTKWGNQFRPDYLKLNQLKKLVRAPFVALTATADLLNEQEIIKNLALEDPKVFRESVNRPDIQLLHRKRSNYIHSDVINLLYGLSGDGIIYCISRRETEFIAKYLSSQGIAARHYHAGLEHKEREDTYDWFLNNTRYTRKVMVATIAFGMGIDKPDIRWVINMALPGSAEDYVQMFGRAGRDGKGGVSIVLWHPSDLKKQEYFINSGEGSEEYKKRLKKDLHSFAEGFMMSFNLRQHILSFFGE